MTSERRMLGSQCKREGFWEHYQRLRDAGNMKSERDSGDILPEEGIPATPSEGCQNIHQRRDPGNIPSEKADVPRPVITYPWGPYSEV